MKKINLLLVCFSLALIVSSCTSSRFAYQPNTSYISCKLQALIPGESTQKVDGVVQLYKDSVLQISFRAPMVKSELALLLYTPNELLVIDRVNKVYGKATYPIKLVEGITVYSFADIQQKIIKAAQSNKKHNYFLASSFGWELLGEATVDLYKFTDSPFNIRSSKVSKRYSEVGLKEMLQSTGI